MNCRVLSCALGIAALLGAVHASLGASPAAPADTGWTGNGMRVCSTPGAQSEETAAADGVGGVYIGWWDSRSGTFDVYLQHLSGAGVPAAGWPSTGLLLRADANTYAYEPVSVIPDGAGGAIVGWLDNRAHGTGGYNQDIYAQRISSGGAALWPPGGVRVTASNTVYSCYDMAADGAGGALFSWQDVRSAIRTDHAYAQRVNAGGQLVWAPAGVSANVDTTDRQYCPQIVPDGTGGAIVSWSDQRYVVFGGPDGPQGTAAAFAQRLNASGVPVWPDSGLAAATDGVEVSPYSRQIQLVADGAGGALISTQGIVRRWSSAGSLVWDASVPFTGYTGTARTWIMADGAGGAIAAWANNKWAPVADASIYVEHFNTAGMPQWGWPRVCSGPKSALQPISMIPDGAGGTIMAWEDGRSGPGTSPPNSYLDIFAQRVTSSGAISPGWPATGLALCTADSAQRMPVAVTDGAGGAIVVWTDWRNPSTDLYAAKTTGDGVVPTLLSLVSADAEPGVVHLRWFSPSGAGLGAWLYRCVRGEDWRRIAFLTADGSGEIVFDDADVSPGRRYGYRLGVSEGGTEQLVGEVWVDVPAVLQLSLAPPRPNPGSGVLVISLTLPSSDPATLEVVDVAGRRIVREEVGTLGPGRHLIDLNRGAGLPAGIYSIRLTQGGRSALAKATVVR